MECLRNHQNETIAFDHGLCDCQSLPMSDPFVDLLHYLLCELSHKSALSGRKMTLWVDKSHADFALQRGKRSIVRYVCLGLLVFVYLLGIGDAIYVAFRVSKSTTSIDQTITEINGEIYPKEIARYLTYISQQFRRLDDYCSRRK